MAENPFSVFVAGILNGLSILRNAEDVVPLYLKGDPLPLLCSSFANILTEFVSCSAVGFDGVQCLEAFSAGDFRKLSYIPDNGIAFRA